MAKGNIGKKFYSLKRQSNDGPVSLSMNLYIKNKEELRKGKAFWAEEADRITLADREYTDEVL